MLELRDFQLALGCPDDLIPPVSLGAMYRLSSSEEGSLRDHLQALASSSFTSPDTRTAFGGLLSQNDEVFPTITGTFKEPLLPWLNPIVDKATSANDFLLTDVRKRRMTIYIGILPNKLAEAKMILNLFFSQLINENTKELPQANPDLKYQCLLLMDEFTSIGRVDIISKSVSYMAGYNLRLFPIIQSLAQLDSVYGKDDSRTLVTNHALQILYTPRIQSDANEYSEMLGFRSAMKESKTQAKDLSRSLSEEKRALMLPQELKAMSSDKEIIIFESLNSPIYADKIRYYKDPNLTKRLLPKVVIPTLADS
jgi:type IV secretion system protein VirD4